MGGATGTPTLDDVELDLPDRRAGKVRVSYRLTDQTRLFVTTDRLSAFDRVITAVPAKGQVLNQLSAWWFGETRPIIANHLVSVPDPNLTVARSATPLPVEVVVRGHITGVTSTSLWQLYAGGARTIYGQRLPEGLRKNAPLPTAMITPTTKAAAGGHDEPVSPADVVRTGLVDAATWGQVCEAALAVFTFGQRVAERAGLLLADTKYEFGRATDTGELLLIDEVHTPDSSRFWVAASYEARVAEGDEPESLDKEFVRRALLDLGYRGEGPPPQLDTDVITATSTRYISAYERITGQTFVPAQQPARERVVAAATRLRAEVTESPATLDPASPS